MSTKQNSKFAKAVKVVSSGLLNDGDLWNSYQANIAMSFVDACSNYKQKNCKAYLTRRDTHHIANIAAHNFLVLLTDSYKKK